MKPLYWVILGVIVLIPAVYVGVDIFGPKPLSADKLAEQALSASKKEDRLQGVSGLTMVKNKTVAMPLLLRVAKDSTDPEVKAAALYGLMTYSEDECMPTYLAALGDADQKVRKAAYEATLR